MRTGIWRWPAAPARQAPNCSRPQVAAVGYELEPSDGSLVVAMRRGCPVSASGGVVLGQGGRHADHDLQQRRDRPDGTVYFSDPSHRFPLWAWKTIEHQPNGRLLAYWPSTGTAGWSTGLYFPNGVALSPTSARCWSPRPPRTGGCGSTCLVVR
jgi:hypothetical protein